MRNLILLFVFSVTLLFSNHVLADEKPNLTEAGTQFPSISNMAVAVLNEKQKTFTVFAGGNQLYTSYPETPVLKLGKLYVTDNGRYVTWLLSEPFFSAYCPVRENKNGKKDVITDVKWEELPAMLFYREGLLRKTYLLSELVRDEKLMTCSESHVSWLKAQPFFDSRRNSLQFETVESLLYNFSPKTGEVFSVRRTQ